MGTEAKVRLRKTHEYAVDRIAGEARLVRVNPVRDFGWNSEWDGRNSEKKTGDTTRIIVQRLHGTDVHHFFTGDGEPLDPSVVPQFILDDIKERPLLGEVGGQVDTIAICKVCHEPLPNSLYPQHLEGHLLAREQESEAPELKKPRK